MVRLGPTGPVTSLEPWTYWIPPDLHGFYKWAMDTLALLNEFVLKVSVTAKLYAVKLGQIGFVRISPLGLINGFVLSLFLLRLTWLVSLRILPMVLEFWSNQLLLMPIFVRHGCLTFRREGHPVVTVQAFLDFVGDHLPQEPFLELPILTGEELYEAAMAKKPTAAGLDGWAWNEIKALSLSWFVGLALVLRQVEATGQWPQGLLDAYIATPLVNALCAFYRLFIVFGPRFVLPILRNGSIPGSLTLSLVLAKVYPRLMPGMPLLLTCS